MAWVDFADFHRAALAEYLDLLSDELKGSRGPVIVDGGAWHPTVLVNVLPVERLLCVSAPHLTSMELWEGNESRLAMREYMHSLPDPDQSWRTFLEYDAKITETVRKEAESVGMSVLPRRPLTTVEELADQAQALFGLDIANEISPR
jgi:hypothetical protein